MLICPTCRVRLVRVPCPQGALWGCPSCGGRAATTHLLRRVVDGDFISRLWHRAKERREQDGKPCPSCARPGVDVPISHDETVHLLDVCTRCHVVWFDPSEFDEIPKPPAPPEDPNRLESIKARQAAAFAHARLIGNLHREEPDEPDSVWEGLITFLGFPFPHEETSLRRKPWLTWSLATACALATAMGVVSGLDKSVDALGLIPGKIFRLGGLTVITSFFLHAGLLHLLGNLYFLLVFGDNVEDLLGKARYGILIALADLSGNILHAWLDPRMNIPLVGASGGISGIIVFYALRFPLTQIGLGIGYGMMWRYVRVPVILFVMLWVGIQALGGILQAGGFGSTSYLAHLGGAGIGFVFWLVWRKRI